MNGGKTDVDDPNTLTQDEKNKLINQAKLIAGITAAYAGEDVNVAAGVAAEAVENNALVKSDDIKNFYLHYNIFCSSGSSAACDAIIHQWKY
ncbi:hemolysin, partial [Moraxella catarrhalis]